jgi:hypothetical protein
LSIIGRRNVEAVFDDASRVRGAMKDEEGRRQPIAGAWVRADDGEKEGCVFKSSKREKRKSSGRRTGKETGRRLRRERESVD